MDMKNIFDKMVTSPFKPNLTSGVKERWFTDSNEQLGKSMIPFMSRVKVNKNQDEFKDFAKVYK